MYYLFKYWHEEQAVRTIDTSVHDCRYWKQHNNAKLPDGDSYLYKNPKVFIQEGERNTAKNLKSLYGYYYLTTNWYEVYNARYFPTKLTYNKVSGEMTGMLENHKLNCDVGQGYCQTPGGLTYTFSNMNKDCPGLEKKLATNVTAYMHIDSDTDGGERYITVPEIGLSFDAFKTCNQRTEDCYGEPYKELMCTSTHFIIAATDSNG